MMANDTPITDASTIDHRVAVPLSATLDGDVEGDRRTEQDPPQTSPEPEPRRMDDKLQAGGGLDEKDGEPAAEEDGEPTPANGSADETAQAPN